MRGKRTGRPTSRRRRREPASIPLDMGSTARQVATIETGTGVMHGPFAVILAVATAVAVTGARALWKAFTRDPSRGR